VRTGSIGSIHLCRPVDDPAARSPVGCLAEAVDRIAGAARRVPQGRHLLWLRLPPDRVDARERQTAIFAAALLGALAHGVRAQFIGGAVDCGDMATGARSVASLLTSRLPLPNGSFIEAELWHPPGQPRATSAPLGGAWRFVAAAGSQVPRFAPGDADRFTRLRDEMGRPAIARLFRGERVPRAAFDAVDATPTLDLLVRSGLAESTEANVVSGLRWSCHDGACVISDADVPDALQGPAYLDPLWEAPVLCRLFPDVPVERALDVGCGAGLTSLRLAAVARHVTALDVNPRALVMTRMNCAMNAIGRVTFVQADLFEQIECDQFDAVVFNSPTDREGTAAESLLFAGEGILDQFLQRLPSILSSNGWSLTNLACNASSFGNVLDRAAEAFGADLAHRDIAFVETGARASDESWARGVLLVAPGSGRTLPCTLDYARAERPIRIEGPFCIEAWLRAISEAML
jgi:SAM-dependent methyltransferase